MKTWMVHAYKSLKGVKNFGETTRRCVRLGDSNLLEYFLVHICVPLCCWIRVYPLCSPERSIHAIHNQHSLSVFTHTCTYRYTHTQAYVHPLPTHTGISIPPPTHTQVHGCPPPPPPPHTHTHTHIILLHTHTHTHTHMCAHTHTHTHMHTHIHTPTDEECTFWGKVTTKSVEFMTENHPFLYTLFFSC